MVEAFVDSNVFYRQLGASGEAEYCALISLLWSKSAAAQI